MTAHVWYVSYGSNMAAERLAVYLRGGTPTGSTRLHPGARDPADPVADEPCRLAHRRFFAGRSRTWGGGGVAFVDPLPGSGDTPARRYLLTVEQFHDVWAQESGRTVGTPLEFVTADGTGSKPASSDLDALAPGTSVVVGGGGYDRLLVVGRVDGIAVVTFTSPSEASSLRPNPPSAPYRAMIAAGLRESHAMTDSEAHAVIEAEVFPGRTARVVRDIDR
ncbi:MAG: histone deacetylase [Acidimicrobiales bacterium]